MGQALYRAYRSKSLSEIIGQEHITDTLARSIKNGTISHAYLFTGPHGVGKTSIARILAHEINNLPYDDNSTHLDIIEIDAASNRRIDEIRDLRDKVHIAPTSAKYKVYIIDEVHMLTKEAFNALLKTLEEPPAHVVFILATTEAHKLPETIISRTQRFTFKPIDYAKMVAHLKYIAKQEGIKVDDDALGLIAEHGGGAFRDSISLLDQIRNISDSVSLADVQATLGIAPAEAIENVMAALAAGDVIALSQTLKNIQEQGFDAAQVARQLAGAVRGNILTGQSTLAHEQAMQLLTQLIEVPASSDPRSYLEIALLDIALQNRPATDAKPTPAPAPKIMKQAVEAKAPVVTEPHPSTLQKPAKPMDIPAEVTVVASSDTLSAEQWSQVLGVVKKTYNTLYSILRMADTQLEPGKVRLGCDFAFNQKRLSEAKNRQILIDTIKQTCGLDVDVSPYVREAKAEPKTPPLPPADEVVHNVQAEPVTKNPAVDAISNIFGGAELLES